MPLFGLIAAAILLLVVCSFFPRFLLLRRLRWTPLEKLSGSIGSSLILVYAAKWGVYCLGPQAQRPAYWAIAGACALTAVLSGRDALRFFRTFRVRQSLLGFGFLLALTFAMLAMIRVYSGAGWKGDWAEHLQRSLYTWTGATERGPNGVDRLMKRHTESFSRSRPSCPGSTGAIRCFGRGWPAVEKELRTGLEREEKNWGGWPTRHGGAVIHIGDHVAGPSGAGIAVASTLLVALFAACLWLLAKQAAAPAVAVTTVRSAGASRRGGAGTSRKGRK